MKSRSGLRGYMRRNYDLYLLLLPSLAFIILFNFVPMYGIQIAFRKYNLFASDAGPWASIAASKWVGLKYFHQVMGRSDFLRAFRNTIIISGMKILFIFPLPIIFAIMLNEVRSTAFQRSIQLIVYMPHFLSWAVVGGLMVGLLGSTGLVNQMIMALGGQSVKFMMDNGVFRWVLVVSDAWKEIGWSSIIYFAAIAGLDQECYEAATVDGASRLQQVWYITIPGLMPTIIMMLIMRMGSILDAGFGQIFALYNSTVYESADIIGTYVYRLGLGKLDFSTGTAVGLFNSVIGFFLMITANLCAKKWSGKSIW